LILPYKEREIDTEKKVEVYRNLNASWKCFSIKQGKVVAHADRFKIENVEFKVNEKQRQKVVEEGRKNVHARLKGNFVEECEMDTSYMDELYYDPYTTDTFINKRTGERLHKVDGVYFEDGKAYILL